MRPRLVGTVVLLLALGGCRSSQEPSNIAVDVSVAPDAFRAGTAVSVNVTVTNLGDRPRRVEHNTCGRSFDVTTIEGVVVGPPNVICTPISDMRELAPGAQVVFEGGWNWRQGTITGEQLELLPPGRYLVRGFAQVFGYTVPVRSRPVEVVVTE